MSNKIWDDKTTDLNLNGPEMSFSSDASQTVTNIAPNGQTGRGTDATSVVFSGVATCTFDSGADTTGTVNYQWYDASTNQALGVSTQYSGQNTNTLTWNYGLSNQDNGKNFYLQADFTPVVNGTTADPLNEPIKSSEVTLNVLPELGIETAPSSATVPVDIDAFFNCIGVINLGKPQEQKTSYESTEEAKISYQWYIDGVAVTDGTRETTRSANIIEKRFSGFGPTKNPGDFESFAPGEIDRGQVGGVERIETVTIPDDATDVTITVVGGAGGAGGNDRDGQGGSGGTGQSGTFTIADGARTLTFYIGGKGGYGLDEGFGVARGGTGGSSTYSRGGNGGWDGEGGSGGGGGGAGGVFVHDSVADAIIIAAAGGAGGGGGSLKFAGDVGGNARGWTEVPDANGMDGITQGTDADELNRDGRTGQDGGGGGGGGGGHQGGDKGFAGLDQPPAQGCTDPNALNYDPNAEVDDGSCSYPPPVRGCTDPTAENYNSNAEEDDGSCTYPPAPSPSPPPDDGFDPCFTEDTRVIMWTDDPDSEDLIMRPISQIMVGDYVMNKDRTKANKVVFVQKHDQADQHPDVYSPSSEIEPFATLHHPLFVDGEWIAVKTNYFPWLEKNKPVPNPIIKSLGDRELYNLWVTGDGTYTVNGYGTHSILYDGGFMRNSFDQNIIDHGGVMKILEQYVYYNKNLIYGSFLFNRLIGKINLKWLNKLCVNFLNADDNSRRKKLAHFVMRVLVNLVELF